MSRRFLWVAVPSTILLTFVGAGFLLASSPKDTPAAIEPPARNAGFSTEPITDEQGAVAIEVTQLNLNGPGETLDFRVGMNTHSVELDMDLVESAQLSTDTGLTIAPAKWEAPSGGHHVAGTLSFASSLNGAAVLEGVTELTLTLRNIDAPERVFVWALKPTG